MRHLCIFGILCLFLIVFSQKGHAQCNVGATYKQIYKEDFESGIASGFTTTYGYNTSYLTGISKGTYSIRKNFESFDNTANCSNDFCWGTWSRKGRDHTSGNGYFYIINAKDQDLAPDGVDYFFERTFTGLCGGTTLQFEIWVANPCFSGCSNYPDFLIEFINPTSNVVINSVRPFPATTNPLYHSYNPPGTTVWEDKAFQWRLVRATMSLPSTVGSVKVRVKNLVTGTNESGNDIVIDDIAFSVCVPGSTGTQSCVGTSATQESVKMAVTTTGITNPKYQWQRSTNGTTWTDIAGATASTYTSPLESFAAARYYRCRYGESTMIITGETNINCTGQFIFTLPARTLPVITSGATAVCAGSSVTLTSTSGTSYQWYKNGTAISGATSRTYVATTSGSYTVGTIATNTTCQLTSAAKAVTIYAAQSAGTLTATKTATCYNTAPGIINGAAATGGTGAYTYLWEQSTNSGTTWVTATGTSNTQNYTPPALTATTQYRRKATNTCGTVTSNTITVTVYAAQVAGALTATKTTTCYNTAPGIINGAAATGGTGAYTYLWEQSTNSGTTWVAATGTSNTQNYTPPVLTATTQYRRKATNTCGTVTSNTITVTVYAALVGGTTAGTTAICYNKNSALSVTGFAGGTGTLTYQWQSSTNGVTWANIASATAVAYTTPNLTAAMRYRRMSTNTCGTVYSTAITVTPYANLVGGTTAGTTAICYNKNSALSVTGFAGGTGTLTYQWQNSTDGVTWTNIASATAVAYTTPNLTAAMRYRRVSTNTCGTVYSSPITVTPYANLVGGTTAGTTAICYNKNSALSVTGFAGGTGTLTYQWQNSTDGVTWTNIASATAVAYTTPNLTAAMRYRRMSTNTCGTVYSSVITVTPYANLVGGTTAGTTAICYNKNSALSVTGFAGGTGTLTYQWQSSTDGVTWANIASATAVAYTTPNLTAAMRYRRMSTNTCGTVYSSVITVTPYANLVGGTTAGTTAICYNKNSALSVTGFAGGVGTLTYQWQSSTDGVTWANIASATAVAYTTPNLTAAMRYRRMSTNTCGTVYSSVIIVTPYANLVGGTTAGTTNICYNTTSALSVTGFAGGTGTLTYQWQSSTDGVTWANIASATAVAYTTPNLTAAMRYRRMSTNTCGTVYSSVITVTPYANLVGGTTAGTTNICYNTTSALSVTGFAGGTGTLTYQWQSSTDGVTWANIASATAVAYTTPNLTAAMRYRRMSTNTCGTVYSTAITVTPYANLVGGTTAGTTNICYNTTSALSVTGFAGGVGTLTYQWQNSTDGVTWANIASATAVAYTTPNLTAAMRYRRMSTNTCGTVYSTAITVTPYANLVGGTIAASQSLWANNADPVAFTNTTAASGGTLTYQYQWESSTDNITWTSIAGATSLTYDAPALTTTTHYRRKVTSSGGCGIAYSNEIRVFVIKPNALQYTACPNALVSMGVNAITGVTFRWYATNSPADITVLATGLTCNLTKDASALQTLWVEPEYGGVKYPRIPIYLSLASGCGETDPSGCVKDGTVIFKEDFGGNNISDPVVSPAGIPQVVGYTYNGTAYGGGTYGIRKQSFLHPNNIWYVLDDHTFKNDITRGYMLQFDATAASGQFYKHQLDNLCSGTTLYFSAWITSAAKIPTYVDKTNMIFVLEDLGGNVISKYHTGNVPDVDPNWKQYGFSFKVPSGVSSLVLKIINNGTGTSGNDFVMDDIEVRFCAPPVITKPENDTTVCLGSKADLQLKQNYVDDGTFGNNLDYRWEFKAKGSSTWVSVSGTAGSSTNGIVTVAQSKYTISSTQVANEGDYRFVVAAKGNINSENCRAISRGFNLGLYAALNGGTIAASQSLWANNADPVAFTNTTAASGGTLTYQYQWENSTDGTTWTSIAGATSLTYDAPALTTTTHYRRKVTSSGGCGIAYSNEIRVFVIKPNTLQYTACPNALVSMGVNAITGVTFRWYATNPPADITVLATGLTCNLTKDASALQTLWVEPEYGGVKYPRIPIYLSLASGCGETDPSGCAKDGTILFKEDFDSYDDGLNPLSGQFSSQALDIGRTSYLFFPGGITANDHPTFHTVPKSGYFGVGGSGQSLTSGSVIPASPVWNEYSLMKYITGSFNIPTSEFIYEHTTSNEKTGRMMVIDASEEPGLFYKHEINNLCQGSNLLFSVWVNNLGNPTYPADPNLKFILTNKTDNSVVSIYQTGAIAPGHSSGKKKWLQYSFSFDLPIGVSDIIMHIENVGINTFGNDFAIDDIEIRLCAPPVIIEPRNDTTVCLDSKLDLQLKQDYADDGTFGNNLDYRWEFKATGSLSWASLHSGTSSNGVITTTQSKHTINSVQLTNAGDYRLLIASAGNLDNVNCRANKGFALAMHSALNGGTITGVANVCYKKNTTLNLTGFSGGTGTPTYQWQSSINGVTWANITSATAVSYTTPNLTTSTYYRCATTNNCGTVYSSALQIAVTQPLYVNDVRVETCPMPDRKINLSAYIDLNHIAYLTNWSALTSGTSLLNPSGELMTAQHVSGTYKYKYKVKDHCMSDSANLYLSVVKNSFFRHDTVVICKDLAQRVSLNQAVGAEFNGVWSCSPSTVLAHISTSPEGIIILNGTNVYADPLIPFTSYHGISAKIVDVIYTPNAGDCITTPKTITYVITSDIIN